ncbi:uracil-DNA glycosylase family protein [Kribbella sp. NPDC026596]|uniref:uracil-DNA glycosylase family protein n=1 Tax=Kribbella sp. NPDC026596 TaxID=3155122 RepID=UPI003409533E
MDELTAIRQEIRNHASNAWARERGYEPVYSASPGSRIVVIGQAPGKQAQDSQIPWNDASGIKLRQWLGVTDAQFYAPDTIALLPLVHPSPLNFRWQAKNPWFETDVIPALQTLVADAIRSGLRTSRHR